MEFTNATDLILLHRWRVSRDAEAFRTLAERYAGLVYAAAHRVLRDSSEAEDVAQECFLTLAQARKPPERNLGAWLHAAAVNRAKNHIRGEVRRRQREQHYDALQPDRIQIELNDTLAHVDEAIAALDDELRHVIVAHFLEAKSQGEIADTTGVSRQTVNARVKRGVEAIREHLGKKGITATTASLTALLGAEMVEAAPLTLLAALGKVALSGGAVAGGGVGASLVGLLTTKVTVGLGVIMVAILSILAYQELASRSRTPVEHPAKQFLDEQAESPLSEVAETRAGKPRLRAVEALPTSADIMDVGNVLAGTILDEDGGPMKRPVTVYAFANFPQGLDMGFQSPDRESYTRAHLLRHTVSNGGTFELDPFTNAGAQGTIYAVDEENNVMSEEFAFDLSSGDQRDVTLRFHHYGSIAGTLLDRLGAPVTGATLSFRGPTGSFEAKVDENGRFVTAPVPPGDYEVQLVFIGSITDQEQNCIRFPMSVPKVLVKEGEQVDSIALVAKCEITRISGRVVDELGRGIPDLRLVLRDGGFEPGTESQVDRLFGATNNRGYFDLGVYGPGKYKLDVASANYELPEPVAVRSGELDLELHARVGGKKPIRFHVVDGRNGKSVDSATFRLPGPIKGSGSVTTFRDGRFNTSMRAEEAKGVTVSFSSEGVGVATYAIKATDLGGPEILITLQPIPPVQGQVLDSEGNPKANVRIHDSWVSEWEPRTRTDAQGRFELTDLDPEQEVIYLFSKDEPQMSAPIVREGGWTIKLPRGAAISGVVLVNGRPLEGVNMNLSSKTDGMPGDIEKQIQTDAHGQYKFQGVAPGEGTVRVQLKKEDRKSVLGTIEKSVAVSSGTPINMDFNVELRAFDASLRGMLYEGGQPAEGSVNVRRLEGNGSQNVSFVDADSEGGFRIADLVSGDVEVTANIGRCRRTFTHHLMPGDNSVDINFPRCRAALECTFPISEGNEVSVTTNISVETEFGEETLFDMQSYAAPSGIRIEDLPEGTATISVQGSEYNREYERRVKLVSGSTTTLNFSADNALIDFILSGVQDSEQVVVFAFPGSPELPDASAVTPDIYMAQLSSLQPIAFLERAYLARPLKHLEAGTYTLVACAFSGEANPASSASTQGFRTFSTEVTLEPGREAQVTLAFP